jgi:hypothetical protein
VGGQVLHPFTPPRSPAHLEAATVKKPHERAAVAALRPPMHASSRMRKTALRLESPWHFACHAWVPRKTSTCAIAPPSKQSVSADGVARTGALVPTSWK